MTNQSKDQAGRIEPSQTDGTGELPRMPGERSAGGGAPGDLLPPPPTSFGRQMAQLVIIPAVIVMIAIAVVASMGFVVRSPSTLDGLLYRLQQPSGMGRTVASAQDPRYIDRCRAAQDLATRIPHLDEAERLKVHNALVTTLEQHINPATDIELQTYLLLALGMVGQEGGLPIILDRLNSEHPRVVEGAVGGVLVWPDTEAARVAVPALIGVLNRSDATVRAEAAAALGKLAYPGDQAALEALYRATQITGNEQREVAWNAAVAMAKLDDPRGVEIVVNLLLNREALSKLPADTAGRHARTPMPQGMQDRVMMHTLYNVISLHDDEVVINMPQQELWDHIALLAEHDTSRPVRQFAGELLEKRRSAAE